jgi:hypothetical protein
MASKRNSEKRGGVRPSQRQRVLTTTILQHKQESTKKLRKGRRFIELA